MLASSGCVSGYWARDGQQARGGKYLGNEIFASKREERREKRVESREKRVEMREKRVESRER